METLPITIPRKSIIAVYQLIEDPNEWYKKDFFNWSYSPEGVLGEAQRLSWVIETNDKVYKTPKYTVTDSGDYSIEKISDIWEK